MNIETFRQDAALLNELGKALHNHSDIQSILDKVQKRYEEFLRREEEANREKTRRDRMGQIEISRANLFQCWLNAHQLSGYRMVLRNSSKYSKNIYHSRDEAERELQDFIRGSYDQDHWEWVDRDVLVKEQIASLGLEDIPISERFELYGFTWTNNNGREMHEVFLYDRLTRFKSCSKADSNGFDLPVKSVYDLTLYTIQRQTNDEDINRFARACITSSLDTYITKSLDFFKIQVETENIKFLGPMYKSYKIDKTKKYKLTSEYKFVMEGE